MEHSFSEYYTRERFEITFVWSNLMRFEGRNFDIFRRNQWKTRSVCATYVYLNNILLDFRMLSVCPYTDATYTESTAPKIFGD